MNHENASRDAAMPRRKDIEEVASIVIDSALQLHKDLGSGLLESVYEVVLAKIISTSIIELKSVETIHPVHPKQLLTYLPLMNLPLGLLINFGEPLLKDGLKRVVNNHTDIASSRLRVHNNSEGK